MGILDRSTEAGTGTRNYERTTQRLLQVLFYAWATAAAPLLQGHSLLFQTLMPPKGEKGEECTWLGPESDGDHHGRRSQRRGLCTMPTGTTDVAHILYFVIIIILHEKLPAQIRSKLCSCNNNDGSGAQTTINHNEGSPLETRRKPKIKDRLQGLETRSGRRRPRLEFDPSNTTIRCHLAAALHPRTP